MKLPYPIRIALICFFAFHCSLGTSQDTLRSNSTGEQAEAKSIPSLTTCTSRSERNEIYRQLMDSVRLTMTKQELKQHELFLKGKEDARHSYEAKGGMWVTLTLYNGIPFYLASTPWKMNVLRSPNSKLLNDPLYYAGYKRGVRRVKTKKILLGAAVFVPIGVLVIILSIKSMRSLPIATI